MSEDPYQLIDLDQMEPSLVRRRLRRWRKDDEEVAASLVHALKENQLLTDCAIVEPRYETNVYPLYYYWHHSRAVKHPQVYECVFQSLPAEPIQLSIDELRKHVGHTVDSEIDILIEDRNYFAFIEAKEAAPSHKVKFEMKGGVHQLVHQYIQGKILEKSIRKSFVLATIGANKGQPLAICLTATERSLVHLVDETKDVLKVVDLTWSDAMRS